MDLLVSARGRISSLGKRQATGDLGQNAAGLGFMLRAVREASPSLSTFCGNAVAGNCFGGAKSAPPERIEANYFEIPLVHH